MRLSHPLQFFPVNTVASSVRRRVAAEVAGNVARAAVCVCLLAASLAAGAQDPRARDPVRIAPSEPSHERPSRLYLAAHPAADPLFGALWSVSHRLIVPVQGVDASDLVDSFTHPRSAGRRHEAIDIPAPRNTPVLAATDGTIVRLAAHDSGGISLYQLAPDGRTLFYYAHLSGYAPGVHAGVPVRQGDVIGYVGDTGNPAPGSYHLHFEIMTVPGAGRYRAARSQNPYPLLKRVRG